MKYLVPTLAIILGFLVLGPLGSILAFGGWYLYNRKNSVNSK